MIETEQRSLILRERYELTVPERAMIERGLLLVEYLGKKEYTCPILGAKFVLILAGTFMMGSPSDEPWLDSDESPHHQVTISKPFYLQTTPVTQGQWKKVMGNNPSYFKGDDNLPVEQVSWNDVQKFIRKLNKMEGTNKYHLPTEAQWEYAARSGRKAEKWAGTSDESTLGDYAWYFENSDMLPHPVGQKKPNGLGLYDMSGNVWELVQDWKGNYPSGGVTDPEGPSSGSYRVDRGGDWSCDAWHCRSAYRDLLYPDYRNGLVGFRLLRTVEQDRCEPDRRESLEAEQSKLTKKQLAKSKRQFVAKVRETGRDGDFIAFNNGTVLDTRTNLMWADGDNGADINWRAAKKYCENYRGGGYSDWRMPTSDELEQLYNEKVWNTYGLSLTNLISLSGCCPWASEIRGSHAAGFGFDDGERYWRYQSGGDDCRALPVRFGK